MGVFSNGQVIYMNTYFILLLRVLRASGGQNERRLWPTCSKLASEGLRELRFVHEQGYRQGPKGFPDQQGVPGVNRFPGEDVSPRAGETVL